MKLLVLQEVRFPVGFDPIKHLPHFGQKPPMTTRDCHMWAAAVLYMRLKEREGPDFVLMRAPDDLAPKDAAVELANLLKHNEHRSSCRDLREPLAIPDPSGGVPAHPERLRG